ncbi:hypothetical protein A7D00_0278 [Trichophyton violaceum]|uniref:Uncharacterized protein n=1 Tax=Trichophyton violaceum TaxID=34388 RepID=A0A178FRB2_TRIVO|nr:hypothetical protein A7D00_0278 [Trichophyton violaceum]
MPPSASRATSNPLYIDTETLFNFTKGINKAWVWCLLNQAPDPEHKLEDYTLKPDIQELRYMAGRIRFQQTFAGGHIHYRCFLPLREPFHGTFINPREPCAYDLRNCHPSLRECW